MVSCSVRGCRMDSRRDPGPNNKGLKFYSFPRNLEMQQVWNLFCDSPKTLNYKTARICARHFEKKYYFKRPIDIALGLSCPVMFRNLSEDAVPTLNAPPKEGEQSVDEDDLSIANIDWKEANPESSDPCSEAPRYIFSGEAVSRMMEAQAETDSASETEEIGTIKTETLAVPPPPKKLRAQRKCRTRSQSQENLKKTIKTEKPYMEFHSDKPSPEDAVAYCDELIAQNNEVLGSSDSSQYVILKRSVWQNMEERLQRHFKRSKESNDIEDKYAEVVEENEKLKERLNSLTQGTAGGFKVLKARVADLEEKNVVLTNVNRALKRDKEKLEERTKKHAIMLKQYFTSGQLKRIFNEDAKRLHWTTEDIAEALLLKQQSIPAYKYLQDKFGFLLPDISTLRRWMRKKRKLIEEQLSLNPAKTLSEFDQAVQNLVLLHDQTDDGEEVSELDLAEGEVIEFIVEG